LQLKKDQTEQFKQECIAMLADILNKYDVFVCSDESDLKIAVVARRESRDLFKRSDDVFVKLRPKNWKSVD